MRAVELGLFALGSAISVAYLRLLLAGALGSRAIAGAAGVTATLAVFSESILVARGPAAALVGGIVLVTAAGTVVGRWATVRSRTLPFSLLLVPLLSAALFVANAFASAHVPATAKVARALPVVVVLALVVLVATGELTSRALAGSVILAFAMALVSIVAVPSPWLGCSIFKCGPLGGLLSGPFLSENYLARLGCLALVCCLVIGGRALVGMVTGAAGVVLVATNSRTSMTALAVALLCAVVWLRGSPRVAGAAARLAPPLVLLVSVVLIYSAGPADFSNRGGIWLRGIRALDDSWLTGRGIDTWNSEVLARNFMHSQTLLLLYSAGALSLVLYAVILSRLVGGLGGPTPAGTIAIVVLVLVLGLTEIVWNPSAIDGGFVVLIALLAGWRRSGGATGPQSPGHSPARARSNLPVAQSVVPRSAGHAR